MESAIHDRLQRFIDPGERVAWTGQPGRGLALPPGLLGDQTSVTLAFIVTLSLFPLLLSGFGKGQDRLHAVTLGLFILWMALVAAAYLALDVLRRRNTLYAITDRRALILEKTFTGWRLQSWPLASLPKVELRLGWRSGIWFQGVETGGLFRKRQLRQSGFEMITDSTDVHRLLLQTQREAK